MGSHEERESLTGSPDGPDGVETGGVKRKSAPPETGSKFKVVGTMVVAMQRFQGPRAVRHLPIPVSCLTRAQRLCSFMLQACCPAPSPLHGIPALPASTLW